MVLKVFSCLAEYNEEILRESTDRGIVLLGATTSVVHKYYEEFLKQKLDQSVHLAYTNHQTEGYFYFLVDLKKFGYDEAMEIIQSASIT